MLTFKSQRSTFKDQNITFDLASTLRTRQIFYFSCLMFPKKSFSSHLILNYKTENIIQKAKKHDVCAQKVSLIVKLTKMKEFLYPLNTRSKGTFVLYFLYFFS